MGSWTTSFRHVNLKDDRDIVKDNEMGNRQVLRSGEQIIIQKHVSPFNFQTWNMIDPTVL